MIRDEYEELCEPEKAEFWRLMGQFPKPIINMIKKKDKLIFNQLVESLEGIKDVRIEGGGIIYKGQRIGRDLRMYDFMAEVAGVSTTLVFFIEEVVLCLPKAEPFYTKMKEIGQSYLSGDALTKYLDIFVL